MPLWHAITPAHTVISVSAVKYASKAKWRVAAGDGRLAELNSIFTYISATFKIFIFHIRPLLVSPTYTYPF